MLTVRNPPNFHRAVNLYRMCVNDVLIMPNGDRETNFRAAASFMGRRYNRRYSVLSTDKGIVCVRLA